MRVTSERLRALHRSVRTWYRRNGRQLTWRTTTDPYAILVSEIMLQQTQVGRVKLLLPGFLKRYPTFLSLSRARTSSVIRAWKGLGYNSRAVRLHTLAQKIVREHGGRLPDDQRLLRTLPGVGPYTANAVSCFAFGKHVEVVDVNVTRVLSRLFWKNSRERAVTEIAPLAQRVLPGDAYTWNQALMDIGSTICTARKPRCGVCPIHRVCVSAHDVSNIRRPSGASVAAPRPEPSYSGIPRRLWRGKIVEALRRTPRQRTLTLLELGRMVKHDFSAKELVWLKSVANALERDGVVELEHPHSIRLAS